MRKWVENLSNIIKSNAYVIGETIYFENNVFRVCHDIDGFLLCVYENVADGRGTMYIKLYKDEYDLFDKLFKSLRNKHMEEFIKQFE